MDGSCNFEALKYTKAEKADIDEIFELNKSLAEIYIKSKSFNYKNELCLLSDRIENNIDNYYVIMSGYSKLGYVCYYDDKAKNCGIIADLQLYPEFKGNRIEMDVIKYFQSGAAQGRSIFAYVYSKDTDTINLYKRSEFITDRKLDRFQDLMRFDFYDKWWM